MVLFEFKNVEAAMRFWQVVCEMDYQTEAERTELLVDFAKHGEMKRVWETQRTKEEFIEDMSREHNVLDLTKEDLTTEKVYEEEN